jgi:hypothetical protein
MKAIFTTPFDDYRQEKQTLVHIDNLNMDEPVYKDELIYALNNYNPHLKAYHRGIAHGLMYASALLIAFVLLWLTKL